MSTALANISILIAFILCAVIVWLITPEKPKKSREELKRKLEQAEKHHRARKDIRRLYVKATCEQIRREC